MDFLASLTLSVAKEAPLNDLIATLCLPKDTEWIYHLTDSAEPMSPWAAHFILSNILSELLNLASKKTRKSDCLLPLPFTGQKWKSRQEEIMLELRRWLLNSFQILFASPIPRQPVIAALQ